MREYQHFELFHHRAALMRSQPVALALPRGRSLALPEDFRDDALGVLEAAAAAGLSALHMNESQLVEALARVPDTWGMNQADIDAMPRCVKNFKCQGRLEAGDPYCAEAKFNSHICPRREWMVSWHPGWKWDAVHGYGMALFLMEALEEALTELTVVHGNATSDEDARDLEERLRREERAEYRRVSQGPSLPPYSVRFHGNESFAGYLLSLYYKRPNYCHTAALPSEIRYRGILTNQMSDPPDREAFERVGPNCVMTGIGADNLPRNAEDEDDDDMRLICDSRYRQVSCNVSLNIDHRDYFYVGYPESTPQGRWMQLTLPTDAERAYYGTGVSGGSDDGNGSDSDSSILLEGVIAFCSSDCGGGGCPDADVHFDNSTALGSAVEMRVNGVPVTGLATLGRTGSRGSSCHVLLRSESGGGGGGVVHWDADESGKYQIQVRVLAKDHYVRFSSFIVF
jgi:hypothetical protein